MSCRRYRRVAPRQGGAALVVALLIFALAAALMVGIQRDFSLTMQRGSNQFTEQQGWAYLRGAEALAVVALRADAELDKQVETPRDDLSELWAAEATPYPLEGGGWLLGQIEDLQGRFNLNLLVADPASGRGDGEAGDGAEGADSGSGLDSDLSDENDSQGNSSDESGDRMPAAKQIFVRLLQALEGEPVSLEEAIGIADGVADFIDSDQQQRMNGAEEDAYRSASPPYRPANQPMASVSELRAVSGMTREIYRALAPHVTVWPREGAKLNILTASATVLRSINGAGQLMPLSVDAGKRLIEARQQGLISDVDSLLEDSAFSGDTSGLSSLLTQTSDWFLLSASVEIAEREMQLYSVLQRENTQITSHYRTRGEL
jgi:general secretion pathway protein K